MSRPTVVLDLASDNRLAKDLAAGGVFVPGCKIRVDTDCELILKAGGRELRLPARIVFVDPARGAGVEIVNCTNEVKEQIAALARTVGIQANTRGGAPLEQAVAAARKNALFDDDFGTKPPPKRMNTLEGDAILDAAHAAREAVRGKPASQSPIEPFASSSGD